MLSDARPVVARCWIVVEGLVMDTSQVTVQCGGLTLTVQNGGIVVDELRGIVTLTGAALPAAQGQALRISAPVEFARAKWRPPRDRSAPYFRRGRWE